MNWRSSYIHALFGVLAVLAALHPYVLAQASRSAGDQTFFTRATSPGMNLTTRDTCLSYITRWGWGPSYGAALMGNHLFTGSGSTLLWLDVTDNRHPVVSWEMKTDGFVGEFCIQDSLGYFLKGNGLDIVDLRNPESPSIISDLQISPNIGRLAVEGHFAFVKLFYGGLVCVDASNPRAPYLRSIAMVPTEGRP